MRSLRDPATSDQPDPQIAAGHRRTRFVSSSRIMV
jgi:hypothetical protein